LDESVTSLLARARTVPAGPDGFAAWATPDGRWQLRPASDWSSGYAVGLRWLSGAPAHAGLAALDPASGPHSAFRGFRGYFGAVPGDVLHGDPAARRAVVAAARALAADERAGIVPLDEVPAERLSAGLVETSIDAVGPVVGLLARAAELTGDPGPAELAARHLTRHLDLLVRPDGSTAQYALLRPDGAAVEVRTGPQGLRPDSTWARSQAWALLATALGARWLPDLRAELLATAARLADWWTGHTDAIPRWDFDAPPGDPLDTSAAAITAAALLRLAAFDPRHRATAARIVTALEAHLTGTGLQDGCYHHRAGLAPANELVWGDHHLLETQLMLSGDLDPLAF
jgi:unsaturated chondroitin disaccharide hydrolase